MDKMIPPAGLGAYLPFAFPGLPEIRCVFTTALAGNVSLEAGLPEKDACANRKKIFHDLGLDCWTELKQVHGGKVYVDPAPTLPDLPSPFEGDGACTTEPGHAVFVKTADCQPILLAHNSGKYVCALHVGWRGNSINFPGTGVADFCAAYKLNPHDVLAVRGPSLGPGAAEFTDFAKDWGKNFSPWHNAKTKRMDLWSLARQQLLDAGLKAENIFALDFCTHSLPELFFSHRLGHAGRQASLIFIKK